jgi:hypothetical protein
LKIKKEVFHIQKLTELEKTANENPNSFWKTLETMDDNTDNTIPNLNSEKQWLTHFETLHSKHSVDTAQHNILEMLNTEKNSKITTQI